MRDWLSDQSEREVDAWESAIDRFYQQHSRAWKDPDEQYRELTQHSNFLASLKYIRWSALIPHTHVRVLDLGAGTGWLSAYLSRFSYVERIDALDSSRHNLVTMLPAICRAHAGDASKIRTIRALFNPLPMQVRWSSSTRRPSRRLSTCTG